MPVFGYSENTIKIFKELCYQTDENIVSGNCIETIREMLLDILYTKSDEVTQEKLREMFTTVMARFIHSDRFSRTDKETKKIEEEILNKDSDEKRRQIIE